MGSVKVTGISLVFVLLFVVTRPLIAQTADCSQGFIVDENLDEIYADTGGNCVIINTIVRGNLAVRNGTNVAIADTSVLGNILITDSRTVTLIDNEGTDGNISILRASESYLYENTVVSVAEPRWIAVRDTLPDGEGFLGDNWAAGGTIECETANNEIDDKVFARQNLAEEINCVIIF